MKEKMQKSKTEEGLWKLTPRWKSAPNADSHRGLKKSLRLAFSQFPQARRRRSSTLNEGIQLRAYTDSIFGEG